MKRALVHNPYWDSLGGGERYVATFVKLLIDQGWLVDLDWTQDISPQIKSRFDIDISKSTHNRQLTTNNYDLVFWVSDGSLPTSFAKKTIVHFQVPFQQVKGSNPVNYLKSRFYTFVSNSRFTKRVVDTEFRIISQVIYPPVDTANFTSTRKKVNTIVYVGRFSNLTQSKGQDILISEFKKLSLSGWKLILVGGVGIGSTDEYLSELKSQAAGSDIEFVFNPSFFEVKKILSTAKIFWSASGFSKSDLLPPSKQEHFGISLVEAMASGCVPIVPNLGGHPEIVNHSSNGFLYDSLPQLESFTQGLAEDKVSLDRLSKNAIQKSKSFSVEVFNTSFLKLI